MIRHFLVLIGVFLSINVIAQTGIGTSTPHASAKLDVSSSTMGFLPPRVTLTAANTFSPIVGTSSAATGLLVYNLGSVGLKAGYYYWNGSNWATIATASSPDQTVDYVSVSTISQSSVGVNIDLIFASNNGGNIPYNTTIGVFTLSANKTYLFQAQVRTNNPSANASHIDYGFVDATTNALLVNGTSTITTSTTSTAGYGSNPVINFIYTPTTNQTVKLRTIGSDGTQTVASGTANITQIGSSAIINPWTLSGTNTFNTTGNVGIGTSAPQSTLDIRGSQGQNYTATTSTSYTVLSTDNVIDLTLSGTQTVTNFTASTTNLNRILTIVNNTSVTTKTISSYVNNLGTSVTTIPANSTLIIQSTGTTWKQINGIAAISNTTITTTNGNGSAGQLLSSNGNGTYTWVSGPLSVRVLSNAGGTLYTQSQLQTLYNNVTGFSAPDVVPIEVVNAANALNNTNWKVYLGHNKWWYTSAQSGTTSNWIVFGGGTNKSDFGANIHASGLFTFK